MSGAASPSHVNLNNLINKSKPDFKHPLYIEKNTLSTHLKQYLKFFSQQNKCKFTTPLYRSSLPQDTETKRVWTWTRT